MSLTQPSFQGKTTQGPASVTAPRSERVAAGSRAGRRVDLGAVVSTPRRAPTRRGRPCDGPRIRSRGPVCGTDSGGARRLPPAEASALAPVGRAEPRPRPVVRGRSARLARPAPGESPGWHAPAGSPGAEAAGASPGAAAPGAEPRRRSCVYSEVGPPNVAAQPRPTRGQAPTPRRGARNRAPGSRLSRWHRV